MDEKDRLKHFFIGDKEVEISNIPEFPGDLIDYALQSFEKQCDSVVLAGKTFEFETEFKMPKEVLYSLLAPNRINQNNYRKMHGIPKIRRTAKKKCGKIRCF